MKSMMRAVGAWLIASVSLSLNGQAASQSPLLPIERAQKEYPLEWKPVFGTTDRIRSETTGLICPRLFRGYQLDEAEWDRFSASCNYSAADGSAFSVGAENDDTNETALDRANRAAAAARNDSQSVSSVSHASFAECPTARVRSSRPYLFSHYVAGFVAVKHRNRIWRLGATSTKSTKAQAERGVTIATDAALGIMALTISCKTDS